MTGYISKADFLLTVMTYSIRDLLLPRSEILKEVNISPGSSVLDYGCGPGGYILPLAEITGESGKIFALDMNPHALDRVRRLTHKEI